MLVREHGTDILHVLALWVKCLKAHPEGKQAIMKWNIQNLPNGSYSWNPCRNID